MLKVKALWWLSTMIKPVADLTEHFIFWYLGVTLKLTQSYKLHLIIKFLFKILNLHFFDTELWSDPEY